MKKIDLIGVGVFAGIIISLIVFFDEFVWLTINYPIPMGFIKVAVLATFGECLKTRLKTGSWKITHPIQRFVVWGLFGIWFTWAFALYSIGVDGIITQNLWFGIGAAFSKSLWINGLGCYAYGMMLAHEYINQMIDKQKLLNAEEFNFDKKVWLIPDIKHPFSRGSRCSIPMIIVWFWLPMHMITFTLPGHFRILTAAFLAVILGFILTIKKK